MRHSIMGEREEIDKERAESGMSGLSSEAGHAQKIMLGHGLMRGVCDAPSALLRNQVLTDCAE